MKQKGGSLVSLINTWRNDQEKRELRALQSEPGRTQLSVRHWWRLYARKKNLLVYLTPLQNHNNTLRVCGFSICNVTWDNI